jgi:hypothetical protein
VLVGESTKEQGGGIACEQVCMSSRAGRAAPALPGDAGDRGAEALKSLGLEAPFVGRDLELRLVKELFHNSAEERKAQLVSVTESLASASPGLLGVREYVDGLARTSVARGRCLSTAKAWPTGRWRMVRMRCGILDDEEPSSASRLGRRSSCASRPEMAPVEPRLAHLLGLEEGTRMRESLLCLADPLRAA